MHIDRRAFVAGSAALAAAQSARAQTVPFVRSDIGVLKRVLVHSVSPDDYVLDPLGEEVLPYAEADQAAAARQQAALMELMRAGGVELVEVRDALASAIDATRASGVFTAWLEALHPRLAADPAAIDADAVLGRRRALQYRLTETGDYRHIADDSSATMWARDSAFMTPRGLVICNAASRRRLRENMLLRFLYAHSPLLDRYPIALDAVEEGMMIEGGDAQIVDERTLFLGVGNRTDPRIAPVLARRLDMDVVTVQTTTRQFLRYRAPAQLPEQIELRLLFLHLDTYFTHVGPRHALAVPFVLERAYEGEDPLSRFIRGARAETYLAAEDAEAALAMLKDLGRVRVFKRGTGEEDTPSGDLKIVDYVRRRGYRVTYTGGPPPRGDQDAFAHFMHVAYPEHRRQATNVVQITPGRVLAYAGNDATKAALEADGVAVDTFEARELWAWHGGPHCLTQPLERG